MLRVGILGFSGGVDFYGKASDDLRFEFKKSLKIYLDTCKEKGSEPYKESQSHGVTSIKLR